jgi:sulfatase maturation enzyme AslB (radical SAM superfamily)
MLENVQTVGGRVKGKTKNDLVYVTWSFTSTCNFTCEYCPTHLHDGKYGFPKYDDAIWFIKSLSQQLPDTAHIVFELVGGEPTLWPRFIEFGEEVQQLFKDKKQKISIAVSTNGSRTTRWFQKLESKNLYDIMIIDCSFHPAMCDPDLFYNNLETISKKYMTNANFMLDPKYFWKSIELIERVNDNLPVDTITKVLRAVDNKNDKLEIGSFIPGYTDEMLEYINNHSKHINQYDRNKFAPVPGEDIIWPMYMYFDDKKIDFQKVLLHKQHSFQGWKCSAGSRRFFIEPGGDIYPCSLLREPSSKLGSINEKNFKIYNDYVVCPVKFCPCKMDAIAEKVKV